MSSKNLNELNKKYRQTLKTLETTYQQQAATIKHFEAEKLQIVQVIK